MTKSALSAEAVEVAAEVMLAREPDQSLWGLLDIQAGIEAAASFIRAQALEDAASELRHNSGAGVTEWVNAPWLLARADAERGGA